MTVLPHCWTRCTKRNDKAQSQKTEIESAQKKHVPPPTEKKWKLVRNYGRGYRVMFEDDNTDDCWSFDNAVDDWSFDNAVDLFELLAAGAKVADVSIYLRRSRERDVLLQRGWELKAIKRLDLSLCYTAREGYDRLYIDDWSVVESLVNLTALRLSGGCDLSLPNFTNFVNLEKLDLAFARMVSPDVVLSISRLPNLREVTMCVRSISKDVFRICDAATYLSELPNLMLHCNYLRGASDDDMSALGTLSNLKHLYLRRIQHSKTMSMIDFGKLVNLQILDLAYCNLTKDSASTLSALPEQCEIHIRQDLSPEFCNICDDLRLLPNLSLCVHFDRSLLGSHDALAEELSKVTNVKNLSLGGFPSYALPKFELFSDIHFLFLYKDSEHLEECELSDEQESYIRGLPNVREFEIGCNQPCDFYDAFGNCHSCSRRRSILVEKTT